MPHVRSAAVLSALVVLGPLLGQATATAGPGARQGQATQQGVQDLLPASSYAAFAFAGLERCNAAVDAHDAAQLVARFLERVPKATLDAHLTAHLDQAADHVREALNHGGVSPATLRAVLRRPMALGVGRLTLRGMGPSVALLIGEGPAAGDIDVLVGNLVQLLSAHGVQVQRSSRTVAGLPCETFEMAQGPTFLAARTGGAWVLTNSEGYLGEIAATAAGRQPALASASSLGSQRARLGEAPLAEAFVHTEPFWTVLAPWLPYEAGELGDAFGVRTLGGVYAAVAPSRGGTVETVDLALRGSPHGLLKAAFAGRADAGAADFCSDETIAFGSFRCDAPAAIAAFDHLFDVLPRQAQIGRRQVARNLQRDLRRLGVEPEQVQQLLASLDGSVSFALSLAKGAPLPEALVILPVRDAQVVGPWLERLRAATTESAGIEWKTRMSGDTTIYYCDVPGVNVPLSPCLASTDGYLLAASQPRVLIAALKQRADRAAGLAGTEDFAAAARENAQAAAFLHLRQAQALRLGWRMIESLLLPQLDKHQDQLGFGSDALPEEEELARGLGTTTLSLTIDEDGARLRARGTLGLGGLMVGGARLVDELLGRAAGKVY